jgi:S-disulfanyl-L-cysteine oxidoreductase SoxD
MSRSRNLALATALASILATPLMAQTLGLGRAALPEEITAWDVAVLPDGTGLPEGSGDVETGEAVFAEACASCHGDFAEGIDSWPVLAGGMGTLQDPRPVKTIGSYWPYLSTVFDYVHRSMPFGAAQTISVDETYAIAAFLLYSNGLVEDDFVLSKDNFTKITLPNAEGFYPDDRAQSEYPLFTGEPCMTNCAEGKPEVTKRAVLLNVTPEDPDGRPAGTLPALSAAATPAAATATDARLRPHRCHGTETPAAEPAKVETAAADPALIEQGQKVFRKCAACHKVGDGAKNGTGPALNGIVGRPSARSKGSSIPSPWPMQGLAAWSGTRRTLPAIWPTPRASCPRTRWRSTG